MAEPSSILHPTKLPTPKSGKAQQASSKLFLSSLLYKFIFFVVFVALRPLFPSQAPEFVSETIFTRVWELLQLLFVGIFVSYGLFSRRNTDPDVVKEPPQKDDSPRSFVSQMLHVSSVFDDDDEVGSPLGSLDESKIQTWSSQYYRNEPAVLVANRGANGNHATNKPLLLPVRSLKSCDRDSESSEEVDGHFGSANGIKECLDPRNGSKEYVVLPSPIPWRSRSGRMETKDELGPGTGVVQPPCSLPPPAFDADRGLSRTPSFRSPAARASSTTPSPKRHSPSPSPSPEIRAKSSEDVVKTKSNYKSTPPPAPPPPPPPPAYLGHAYPSTPERKATARSFKDELKDLSRRGREGWQSINDTVVDPPVSTAKPRSVRTVRAKEVQSAAMDAATETSWEQQAMYSARRPPPVPRYPTRDSDSDDDEAVEHSAREEASSSSPGGGGGGGGAEENEVDKKADEFIAKFREQIRLQRIESIKRSTRQRSSRKPH